MSRGWGGGSFLDENDQARVAFHHEPTLRPPSPNARRRPRRPALSRPILVGLAAVFLVGCAAGRVGPQGTRAAPQGFGEALAAVQRGEGRDALVAAERQAAELDRQGQTLEAAKMYGAVTTLGFRLGEYQKGIRAGLRALELVRAEPRTPETILLQVGVHNGLGYTYRFAGDPAEARRQFQAGLELAKVVPPSRGRLLVSANLSRGLATVELAEGDLDNALEDGKQAVRALEDLLARLPRLDRRPRQNARQKLAWALLLVGTAERKLDRYDEAEVALRQALSISKEQGLLELQAESIYWLGQVALARHDYPQATARFLEAQALATRLDRVLLLIHTYAGIGWTAAGQGRPDDALASFGRSVALLEDVRGQLQDTGLRSGFLEDKQNIYQGAVLSALAGGKPDEAFDYAERSRARAFLDLLGSRTMLSKTSTRALVEEEARLRARLHEALAPSDDDEGDHAKARERVEAAERAYREFLDRVRKENLEQASLMTVEPVTLREVQALLPEGTTLLEYLVSAKQTILWVITRSRMDVVRLPLPRQALLGQVRELRGAIARQAPVEEVQSRAGALYERLLAPARPHLRGERLLIVPHDALHYLPFGALRSPEGKWLVEDFTLSTLPSASVLKYLQGKGADASDRVLALGNPDLGAALALRWAELEARAVGERFPGATVLVRDQATEGRVKTLAGGMGLLHFATHAVLNEQDPLSSALLLAPDGNEDGRLQVREVFALDLHARLVVLSACQTGLGKLSQGDELVGLQRAFLYAGTPDVVTTLWKVDDRASFLLMREFYKELTQGQSVAGALRGAQRAVMVEVPHPFFWAAFGLTGGPP